MKFYITCQKCSAHISKDMAYNIREGICPNCGPGLEISDALGVLEFCEISQTLTPKLNKEQILSIIDQYFKTVLELKSLPEIFIEEEPSDLTPKLIDTNTDMSDITDLEADTPTTGTVPVPTGARTSRGRVKLTPAEMAELKSAPDETVPPITSMGTTFGKRERNSEDGTIQFRSKDELTLHKIGRGTTIPVDADSFLVPETSTPAPQQPDVQFKYDEVTPDITFNRSVQLPKDNSPIIVPPGNSSIREILGEK